jgi:predicted nucleic acid-binding protein
MIVVADTGAIVGLIDRSDRHHRQLRDLFAEGGQSWVLPWAILPEVDYLVATHLGARAEEAFLADLADGTFQVSWGEDADIAAAARLVKKYRDLKLGLVDAVVIATAMRLQADAIVTLDVRDFSAVKIPGSPALWPRDR